MNQTGETRRARHRQAAKRAAGARRSLLLPAGLAVVLLGAGGVAVWESDWMLDRQARQASPAQLQEMAARMPGSAVVQYRAAEQLAQAGQTDAAIAALERARNADPDSPRIAALLGDQWTRKARFQEAGALLQEFARRFPNAPEIHVALGVYYFRVYARPQAAESLRTALQLAPDDTRAWRALGETYLNLDKYSEAAQAFGEALKREPNDVDTLLRRGTAHQRDNKADAAEADLRAAWKLAPGREDARYTLGEFLARYRFAPAQQEEAEKLLAQVARPEARRELGRVYGNLNRWPEAEKALQAYVEARPAEPEGLYLYAAALRRRNRPDATIMARYRAAKAVEEKRKNLLLRVQGDPDNVAARLALARFLAGHGEPAFAILAYERVLHYAPENQEARAALEKLRR